MERLLCLNAHTGCGIKGPEDMGENKQAQETRFGCSRLLLCFTQKCLNGTSGATAEGTAQGLSVVLKEEGISPSFGD